MVDIQIKYHENDTITVVNKFSNHIELMFVCKKYDMCNFTKESFLQNLH